MNVPIPKQAFAHCQPQGKINSLIPITTSTFYHANAANRWPKLLHPNLAEWLVPAKRASTRYLCEGLPQGMALPWADWVKPFFAWVVLALAMYLVIFCIAVLLRKQWVVIDMFTGIRGYTVAPFL